VIAPDAEPVRTLGAMTDGQDEKAEKAEKADTTGHR
jgi:hypothetical protein